MYVEYTTPQQEAKYTVTKFMMKRNKYRPTWLIRTSDWKKVPGTEAENGYHALSYCWEQSGEKVKSKDGGYDLIDHGHHRINYVNYRRPILHASVPFMRQPTKEVLDTKEVTYDELLQQICKDSKVDYLWYDKICIDQNNKAEKQREIKQMHLIYSNAHWTIAIVPEIHIDDPKEYSIRTYYSTKAQDTAINQMTKSLWWKRSWTLEEMMMSTGILVIGRNTRFYSFAQAKQGILTNQQDILTNTVLEFHKKKKKSTNQVLRRAHFRTSTKDHDKIFALANILHDIVSINVDYGIDFLTLTNDFYRQLAQHDLSILCFGSVLAVDGSSRVVTTMGSYHLPSWTGVDGLHAEGPVIDIMLDHNGNNYRVDEDMRLHIKCKSYTIRPVKYDDDVVAYLNDENGQQANDKYDKKAAPGVYFDKNERKAHVEARDAMLSTGNYATSYWKPNPNTAFRSPILPLSMTEDCEECIILDVIYIIQPPAYIVREFFKEFDYYYLSPIVKKFTNGSYIAVGTILLDYIYDKRNRRPRKIVENMFSKLDCEVVDFCIE